MHLNDHEKVEFYVSCRQLKNKDIISKSDPLVRCYARERGNANWRLIGETEKIKDNLNPNFTKTFIVDFVFEVQQPLKFEVIDIDSSTSYDELGVVETTVGAIMGAKKQTLILDLILKNKKCGKIIIRGERTGDSKNYVTWQWSANKLRNKAGLFGKNNPVLTFSKQREKGDLLQVHETETVKKTLNPVWANFQIFEKKLCSSTSTPFKVECWHRKSNEQKKFIGDCELTLDMLKTGQREFGLKNPTKSYNPGTLKVSNFVLEERPSFIDYLRGGVQLNAIIAIDFTGSNGLPNQPSSLHAMKTDGNLNEYQKAISSVCQIVLNYDFDQRVPVYGFGAKPQFPTLQSPTVSHCFPCTGNISQQEVFGLQGIMDIYAYALGNVAFSGPTLFAPLINESLNVCKVHKENEDDVYSILLILTDGEIHDMDETIDALVTAAYLPLSIIIVGIGNADFTKMRILDGDNGLCNSRGERAKRDLVQFVPFNEFKGDMYLLAQHVLAEVPDQLVEYHRLINKKPRPPMMFDMNQLNLSSYPQTPINQSQGFSPIKQNTQFAPNLNEILQSPQHANINFTGAH